MERQKYMASLPQSLCFEDNPALKSA